MSRSARGLVERETRGRRDPMRRSWHGWFATGRQMRRWALSAIVALTVFIPAPAAISATATAVPAITGFNPSRGPVGTQITITGSGFAPGQIVTFNGVAAGQPAVKQTRTRVLPQGAAPPTSG